MAHGESRPLAGPACGALALALLMGCSTTTDSFYGTAVSKQVIASRSNLPEDILGDAVFSIVRGETKQRAIEILRLDGAVCEFDSCVWNSIRRETALALIGLHRTAKERSWSVLRKVQFASDRVVDRSDVVVFISEREIVK